MTKWDSENLDAEHTQRELGECVGLVERLRDKGEEVSWFAVVEEAADRIEQLERELTAEKALADTLADAIDGALYGDVGAKRLPKSVGAMRPARAAYRKARGL